MRKSFASISVFLFIAFIFMFFYYFLNRIEIQLSQDYSFIVYSFVGASSIFLAPLVHYLFKRCTSLALLGASTEHAPSKYTLLLFLATCFNSCVDNTNIKTVSLESEYLPAFTFEGMTQLVSINDTLWVAYLDNTDLMFYNTDSYKLKKVKLQISSERVIKLMDVIDFSNFAFATQDSIFIFTGDEHYFLKPKLKDNVVLACSDVFAFFPEQKLAIV